MDNNQSENNQFKQQRSGSPNRRFQGRRDFEDLPLTAQERKYHDKLRFVIRTFRLAMVQKYRKSDPSDLDLSLRKTAEELGHIFVTTLKSIEKEWPSLQDTVKERKRATKGGSNDQKAEKASEKAR